MWWGVAICQIATVKQRQNRPEFIHGKMPCLQQWHNMQANKLYNRRLSKNQSSGGILCQFPLNARGPCKKILFPCCRFWHWLWTSSDRCHGCVHTPSIAFRHLPPNSARFGYATEGALFISAQLSTDAVRALRKVWTLTRLWKPWTYIYIGP